MNQKKTLARIFKTLGLLVLLLGMPLTQGCGVGQAVGGAVRGIGAAAGGLARGVGQVAAGAGRAALGAGKAVLGAAGNVGRAAVGAVGNVGRAAAGVAGRAVQGAARVGAGAVRAGAGAVRGLGNALFGYAPGVSASKLQGGSPQDQANPSFESPMEEILAGAPGGPEAGQEQEEAREESERILAKNVEGPSEDGLLFRDS